MQPFRVIDCSRPPPCKFSDDFEGYEGYIAGTFNNILRCLHESSRVRNAMLHVVEQSQYPRTCSLGDVEKYHTLDDFLTNYLPDISFTLRDSCHKTAHVRSAAMIHLNVRILRGLQSALQSGQHDLIHRHALLMIVTVFHELALSFGIHLHGLHSKSKPDGLKTPVADCGYVVEAALFGGPVGLVYEQGHVTVDKVRHLTIDLPVGGKCAAHTLEPGHVVRLLSRFTCACVDLHNIRYDPTLQARRTLLGAANAGDIKRADPHGEDVFVVCRALPPPSYFRERYGQVHPAPEMPPSCPTNTCPNPNPFVGQGYSSYPQKAAASHHVRPFPMMGEFEEGEKPGPSPIVAMYEERSFTPAPSTSSIDTFRWD